MSDAASRPNLERRRVEFALLFFAAPIAVAYMVSTGGLASWSMPTAFATLFVVSVVLLCLTREFSWRTLLRFGLDGRWRGALAFVVLTITSLAAITYLAAPHALFRMPFDAPDLWRRISMYYPVFSVIPQGVIYRALFFSRYRPLFPNERTAIVFGALVFALGHLFFLNGLAVSLTFAGGLVFAWAHGDRGGFWFGNLLHAFAGWMVFTVGLGRFFYHGAI